MLNDFVTKVAKENPGVKELKKAKTMLVIGIPTTRILEIQQKSNACMVVMGSKGKTGLKHLLIGSIAEHVTQLSRIPVTIVKAHQKT